jgi:biotin transport system substrate-specific component
MGYLIGFFIATFLVGYLNLKTSLVSIFLKLALSVSTIYILGLFWLGYLIGWDKPVFKLGAMPFLWAELFKILLLTFLTKFILNFRKFI